jgi:prepilin-type N-terminal cleavage/methylation domain-containing protein
MMKASKGYTIIEVLLVLAISSTLLFAAIIVFRGQQQETEFTQAVADLNSKIVNYSNQTGSGTFPDSGDFTCAAGVAGSPPSLASGPGRSGGRSGCIFLGRAFQVDSLGGSDLNIYTVVGDQTINGVTATSISTTNPTIATVPNGGAQAFVLNDTYTLAAGANFKSVTGQAASGGPNSSMTMAGIYTDLNGTAASAVGNLQLDMIGYNLGNNGTAQAKTCVEGSTCTPQPISQWVLCIENSSASRTMQLVVNSNSTGLTTRLIDGGC